MGWALSPVLGGTAALPLGGAGVVDGSLEGVGVGSVSGTGVGVGVGSVSGMGVGVGVGLGVGVAGDPFPTRKEMPS